MNWLRRMLGRTAPDIRALTIRQLLALRKARRVLPRDPILAEQYRRLRQEIQGHHR